MDNFLALSVTYGDLKSAVMNLDFSLTIAEPHRLYYNDRKGSFFGFALSIPLDQKVRPVHLSAARHAVVAMGVTDEATFRKLLIESGANEVPSRYAITNGHAPRRSRSAKPRTLNTAPTVEAH